jgi:2,4-dichlorophenol 6-monooxygenase
MSTRTAETVEVTVPVLIVGAGGSGLSASIFLSDLGVRSMLIERHSSTSIHPKAHILNARTMEIFAQHGVAADIYQAGSPPENSSAMVWLTSLGGDEPFDGKVLYRTGAYGGGELADRYARACPYRHANLGQRWLEPLLREHAEPRNPGGLLFDHELLHFEQDGDGVTATVLDRARGKRFLVRSDYLVGADGGKTVSPALGVPMLGTPTFLEWINLHVRSDFSPFIRHDDAIVNRVSSLSEDGSLEHCGVVPMGPKRWGRHSEEWTLMFCRPPGAAGGGALDDETVVRMVRKTLKLPASHEMHVYSISRWPVEGTVAERFGVGRAFLVGDAAHRHPPSGALGLNTGVQDVHNLTWKLAAVLSGKADPALLDSYHAERRPVAERVVERAVFSLFNQIAMTAGTGVVAGAQPEWNRAQLTALFADTPDGRARRALLFEYFDTNRITSAHLGLEMGYDYADAGYVLGDGTAPPEPDPLGLEYPQSARPGHRLPHAWLARSGQRVSTQQLVPPGTFVCFAGADGRRWRQATGTLAARYGVRIDIHLIGPGKDLEDPTGEWTAVRGHGARGAVLARPDGMVAMRDLGKGEDVTGVLEAGLLTALGRTPAATVGP